jgi:hypothetical protein
MKTGTSFLILLAVVISLFFAFTSCQGPAGPAGPQGTQGPQGPTGPAGPAASGFNLEGFKDSLQCGICHTLDYDTVFFVEARKYQWEASKHAYGGDYERNAASCSGCHSAEGFIRRMNNRTAIDILQPSPIGCFACHSPHLRGDFTLRTTAPTVLLSQITGVPNETFNYGPGNLCVQCHQPRDLSPKMNGTPPGDSLRITSSRWYAHYGVQGQMLMGTGGYKFTGYTYTGNSPHTNATAIQQEGCGLCHMPAPVGGGAGRAGGHTMNLRYEFHGVENQLLNGCRTTGCHASITTLDYHGVQTEVHTLLDSLFHVLGRRGWMDTVETSANFGLLRTPFTLRPAEKAGAIYNYYFVEHDLSGGVHNAPYAKEMLRTALDYLQNHP